MATLSGPLVGVRFVSTLPNGAVGQPCPGLDPAVAELTGITDLDKARAWASVDTPTWKLLEDGLGKFGLLREVAAIPPEDWFAAVADINNVNAVMASRLYFVRRICRLRMGLTPGDSPIACDLSAPVSGFQSGLVPSAPPAGAVPVHGSRKLKELVDPTLDVELTSLDNAHIDGLFADYEVIHGAFPSDATEPTKEQISAVAMLLFMGLVPYVDFSIFGPYGRRLLAKLVFRALVPTPDGNWQRRELPGPSGFEAWYAAWRVFRVCLLLLKASATEFLDAYCDQIRSLVSEYGEACWYIIYTADVRQRSERFEKHRRIAELEHKKDPSKPFNPVKPWFRVFQDAAHDEVFWSKEVHKPALLYLAKIRTIDESVTDDTAQPWMEQPGGPIVAVPFAHHEKRQSSAPHDHGSQHETTRKGLRICKDYNEGKCTRAPGTCRFVHQCSGCLDTHPLCSGLCGTGGGSSSQGAKRPKLPTPPPPPSKGKGKGGRGKKKR
jgi:hypothetical protein